VSFTGDTQIEVLDQNPEILNSRILFFEVTYYDKAKSIEETRKWGHTHFDEMLPYIKEFKGEKLVLIHHSARYRHRDIVEIARKATGEHFDKIFLAPSLYSNRE
jgi:ribonuclease Z